MPVCITPDMYIDGAAKPKPVANVLLHAKIIRLKPKLKPITNQVSVVPVKGAHANLSESAQNVKEAANTSVINVNMQSLRKLYGNKYANQLEWEQGSEDHVSIGRSNSVRIKIDDAYVSWPKVKSSFANPFTAKKYGREESIRLYREYIIDKLKKDPKLMDEFRQLRGKTLGCWCKPEACHGDVLLDLLQDGSLD